MTNIKGASDQVSIADGADLPRPDTASEQAVSSALPRPLPAVKDSGRISFGASCRILIQK